MSENNSPDFEELDDEGKPVVKSDTMRVRFSEGFYHNVRGLYRPGETYTIPADTLLPKSGVTPIDKRAQEVWRQQHGDAKPIRRMKKLGGLADSLRETRVENDQLKSRLDEAQQASAKAQADLQAVLDRVAALEATSAPKAAPAKGKAAAPKAAA